MSTINVAAFRDAARLGDVSLGKDHDSKATIVTSQKKLGGKFLDWIAGNVLKNTNWGSGRLSQMRSEQKIAFNLFVGALKNEYGVKDAHKANIGKAIREAFGNKVPTLNSKNVARMESIAKNFKGTGNAQSLKRNLVVRWWESKGLDHPGHAAAGIRNRVDDNKAPDKYVSFWPGESAGGKGEIFGKAQEGSLSDNHRTDYQSEIADRTSQRLENSRLARLELKEMTGKANDFFKALREIPSDSAKETGFLQLNSALEDFLGDVEVDLDSEGTRLPNQSLVSKMKMQMEDALDAFVMGKSSLNQCITRFKEACNDYTSELTNHAKFEPMSRQAGHVDKSGDVSWGVKAEKFFLPLAGSNQDKNGNGKFTYFGLNEGKMVARYDSLQTSNKTVESKSSANAILKLSDGEIEGDSKSTVGIGYIQNWAKTVLDGLIPNSADWTAINNCIDSKNLADLEVCKSVVADLQKVFQERPHLLGGGEHTLPYKMVSKDDNCAGYITNLMDLGGAGAFASKPFVAVATSPNDTAAWAKSVLKEADRLNQLVDDIMIYENPNLSHTEEELQNLCQPKVWTAYQSLTELRNGGDVSHGELMSKVKTLVNAITNDETLNRSVGALLLKNIQDIYAKAGNPFD